MQFQGLEEAVRDYNMALHAMVVLDKETLKVWTDVFAGPNEWNVYHDSSVVDVVAKHAFYQDEITITVEELEQYCVAAYENKIFIYGEMFDYPDVDYL